MGGPTARMGRVAIAISEVIVLGAVLLGVLSIPLLHYGPLPRKSARRVAAGLISVISAMAILPAQVRIEARLQSSSSYHGPRFSGIAIIIEGVVALCLLFYAVRTQGKKAE